MVAEGRNAWLVPPDDPGALAQALATLAGDATTRDRWGEESRRRAAEYDWSRLTPRYVALLEEVAANGRTG